MTQSHCANCVTQSRCTWIRHAIVDVTLSEHDYRTVTNVSVQTRAHSCSRAPGLRQELVTRVSDSSSTCCQQIMQALPWCQRQQPAPPQLAFCLAELRRAGPGHSLQQSQQMAALQHWRGMIWCLHQCQAAETHLLHHSDCHWR